MSVFNVMDEIINDFFKAADEFIQKEKEKEDERV